MAPGVSTVGHPAPNGVWSCSLATEASQHGSRFYSVAARCSAGLAKGLALKQRVLGLAAAIAVTLGGGFALSGTAEAGAPNNQACLGVDLSGYAKDLQPLGRTLIAAISGGGAGAEVQAHLAGLVPDFVIPNTCND